ncbi:MAG: hypothetical protein ACJATA_002078 [Sphingobacteriales bacterium]|jgi:hypothetical protein
MKNQMANILKKFKAVLYGPLFCLVLALPLTLVSCEDDPILEEIDIRTKGGSYGKMSFSDSTEYAINPEENPELF